MSKPSVTRTAAARIPTRYGDFQLCYYTNTLDNKEHLAFYMGDLTLAEGVLARVHSECFTGDVLGSLRCDCGEQLDRALALVARWRVSPRWSLTGALARTRQGDFYTRTVVTASLSVLAMDFILTALMFSTP